MTDSELFFSLLRVTAAQVLRAAGLTTAKPSVVDAFTDILARYLTLLGATTRNFAEVAGRTEAELDDVRLALEHVGLVRPLNIYNDPFDEDTRGVDSLLDWFRGPQAVELRRVAGFGGGVRPRQIASASGGVETNGTALAGGSATGTGIDGGLKNEEWVAALRKLSEKRGAAS